MKKMLEEIQTNMRIIAQKISETGYCCNQLEIDLWKGKNIKINSWDGVEHLKDSRKELWMSIESLIDTLAVRKILFRKFSKNV